MVHANKCSLSHKMEKMFTYGQLFKNIYLKNTLVLFEVSDLNCRLTFCVLFLGTCWV